MNGTYTTAKQWITETCAFKLPQEAQIKVSTGR